MPAAAQGRVGTPSAAFALPASHCRSTAASGQPLPPALSRSPLSRSPSGAPPLPPSCCRPAAAAAALSLPRGRWGDAWAGGFGGGRRSVGRARVARVATFDESLGDLGLELARRRGAVELHALAVLGRLCALAGWE